MHDVVIIGAGPAGVATAARLHQHGIRDVVVLDRDHFPRDKPCGGGLTGNCAAVMDSLDLVLDVPAMPAHEATIQYGALRRSVTMPRPVQVVRRTDFDANLVSQIRNRGIAVRTGVTVRGLHVQRHAAEVLLSDGQVLRARVVVGADGAGSLVRRQLDRRRTMRPHRLFMHIVRAPQFRSGMVYDFSPMGAGLRGYLWLFPLPEGHVNVGIMHYPSTTFGAVPILKALKQGLESHGVALPQRGTQGWPVWGYASGQTIADARLLLVGDALGIDALTGEGIVVAMEQARVAADSVAAALRAGDFNFAGYGKAIRRDTVGRELTVDTWCARFLFQSGPHWREWLSLMMLDDEVPRLYAERVAGTRVLADSKANLLRALWRHLGARRKRRLSLDAAQAYG